MPKKSLSVPEALALFQDLPSDNDSAVSNDSDTDEDNVVDLTQGENIISSSDDEEIDELQRPSTSRPQVKWNKHFVPRSIPEFTEDTGPSSEVLDMQNPTPLGVFLLFITVKLMEDFVFQSNLYATQEGKQFNPLEFDELLRFLAINLLMGIKCLPSYRDCRSNDPDLHDEYIAQQISVKCFTWILSHLHINDNSLQPRKGSNNFDKLYKIRPFFEPSIGEMPFIISSESK